MTDGVGSGQTERLRPYVAAMHNPTAPAAPTRPRLPGDREMVMMMAMVMALNALAIDSMLPTLPAIGEALGDRKSVVSGKSVSVRVDHGGRRISKKKTMQNRTTTQN